MGGIDHHGRKIHENFVEEKRILSYLSSQRDIKHKGICCIYNNIEWEDEHSYYYTMKCLQCDLLDFINHKLRDLANNNKMRKIIEHHAANDMSYKPWIDSIRCIFIQIVKSVHYLHSKGIAHL